jgi:hypothetical protein
MSSRASLATAAVLTVSSFVGGAVAQTAPDSAAPPRPMTQPDTNPPQTGATEPMAPATSSDTMPATASMEAPVIPMSQDEHRDMIQHSWPNRPMLVTGVVVLGGTYAASAIVAAASDRKADDKLFLPVVGPWLDLKKRDCDVNDCGNDTFNKALLIGDGALQGLGALTLVLSFVIPESTKKPWYLIGDEHLSVAPQVGTAVTGLAAFGQF